HATSALLSSLTSCCSHRALHPFPTRRSSDLFVLGGDGWQSGAGAELAGRAAASGIPILCDWRAYDAVPHDSPAWAGWLGYGRADAVAGGFAEADLLIFVGCARSDVASDGFTIGFDAETVLVSLDTEAT